jgi:hypothetical protein
MRDVPRRQLTWSSASTCNSTAYIPYRRSPSRRGAPGDGRGAEDSGLSAPIDERGLATDVFAAVRWRFAMPPLRRVAHKPAPLT